MSSGQQQELAPGWTFARPEESLGIKDKRLNKN
jgi:hypothetical protein